MSTIRLTGEADHNPGYLRTDVYVSLVWNATRAGRNVSYKLQAAFDVLISQPGSFPNVEPIRRAVHESNVRRLIEVAQDIRWLPADCPIDEMQSVLSKLLWERSEYWWEVCIGTAFTNETPVEIMRDLAYVNWPADALPLGKKESLPESVSKAPRSQSIRDLKARREALGLTQRELAEACDGKGKEGAIALRTYQRVEARGVGDPRVVEVIEYQLSHMEAERKKTTDN